MLRCTCIMLVLLLSGVASSQKAVSKEIQNTKFAGIEFQKADLFHFRTDDLRSQDLNLQGLRKGTIISLDKETIQSLFKGDNEFISIPLPVSERSQIILTLKRHEIFTPDFKLFTSSDPKNAIEYTPGLHYMGIIEGDPTSLVALSIFNDQVMAMIATDEGNFNLGKIKDDTESRHILYNEKDLSQNIGFECETKDDAIRYTDDELNSFQSYRDELDCVRIHIEIDDDIVTNKGGAGPATDYITGLFNQSFVLYANDQVTMVISEILAWTTISPYSGSTASAILNTYQANTNLFNGDLSHLVSFDSIFGGVAPSGDNLCTSNPDMSKCFSGIRNNYQQVPVFSRPVNLITHEMGHMLGSAHTHACVWNGNNTAIDGCYETEGSCPLPPLPTNGGTIMSYCGNYNYDSYINFNHGFGPQPGNVIRNEVNEAGNCLSSCDPPVNYCGSSCSNNGVEFIKKIVVGSINNQSENNGGYADYTSISANLIAGSSYTITLTPNFTGGNKTKSWRVWIDYNHDFDWYDTGEMVAQGTGNNTINVTFTVPLNTTTVTTRMRVSMKLNGYPNFCGAVSIGEVEDYTIAIIASSASCSDGIQNQGETSVDCGGPCPACPPSPSCNDGIQNQGETGIDCGGPCPACPSNDSTLLLGSYFETGLDSWTDGGPDVARVSSSNSYEGSYSIQLADNSGAQSAMTSPVFNLSDAVGLHITFHFKAVSMETGEDFWVQYKNGSGNWTTIGSFVAGTHFTNGNFYAASMTVPGFVPTSAGSLRIQCDASDNNDEIYIDAVTIVKLNGREFIESGLNIHQVQKSLEILAQSMNASTKMVCYPNPTIGVLNIELSSPCIEGQFFKILSFTGQQIFTHNAKPGVTLQTLNVSELPQGMYFVQLVFEGRVITTNKFVKQ